MAKKKAERAGSNAKRKTKTSGKPQLKVFSSRLAFRGNVFEVTVDDVQEPSGVRARRDTVRHSGSVVIMPVDDSGAEPRVLLERQYRYPTGDSLWEFPAGRIDPGEEELAGAKRELLEETGYSARQWKRVLFYYASPGFMDETMAVYLAHGLTRGKAKPEPDEVIKLRFFPLSVLVRKAICGKLRDGKTIAGVLWLGVALSGKGERT
jgi:ADP-ribose pyrophosphatase